MFCFKQYNTMKFFRFLVCFFIILVSCSKEPNPPKQRIFTDAMGNKVELNLSVNRVISLAPNITEIIAAVKGGAKLRGRTEFCNFPETVKNVQVVGNLQNVDYEKIVSLTPDIVFMSLAGNSQQSYNKLKSLGIKVFAISADSINTIMKSIKTIAEIIGTKKEGDSLYNLLSNQLDSFRQVKRNLSIKNKKKLFIVVSPKPLITVAHGFLDEIIKTAGYENIADKKLEDYPHFSREELLELNPDVILYPCNLSNYAACQELINYYPEFKNLKAIQNKKVFSINPDVAFRPSPRFVENIKLISQYLN